MRARLPDLLLALLCSCGGGSDRAEPSKPSPTTDPGSDAPSDARGAETETTETATARTRGRRERSNAGGEATVVDEGRPGSGAPGRLVGVVTYSGAPPERKPIGAIANTKGCEGHAEPPRSETLVVEGGRVANVFVYVSDGLAEQPPAESPEPVVLDQHGCLYVPHVVGTRVGQAVLARNSDPIAHNVHVLAKRNPSPNKTQGAGAKPLELDFERQEVPVTLVCDIHPWMKAYVCVVEHPYFAVTGGDGAFAIEGLPAGGYTLTTWHETLERREVDVSVPEGGEVRVEFAFD